MIPLLDFAIGSKMLCDGILVTVFLKLVPSLWLTSGPSVAMALHRTGYVIYRVQCERKMQDLLFKNWEFQDGDNRT